jgi:DNA-binding beta-propeller fold protein YncE
VSLLLHHLLMAAGAVVAWTIAHLSYASKYKDVSSQTGTYPGQPFFKPDGLTCYVQSGTNSAVYQYTLSTFWDISTASYASKYKSVSAQCTGPYGLAFSADGTKMYVTSYPNGKMYQYSLSTAWDVSTASYDSVSLTLQGSGPANICFNSAGTKFVCMNYTDMKVYQYGLSTAWDLSTASYASKYFNVAATAGNCNCVWINNTGSKLFVISGSSPKVYQYSLSTKWDVSTASYDSVSVSVSAQDASPQGMFARENGGYLYITGVEKKVFEFTM